MNTKSAEWLARSTGALTERQKEALLHLRRGKPQMANQQTINSLERIGLVHKGFHLSLDGHSVAKVLARDTVMRRMGQDAGKPLVVVHG